jgi:hypothetical protein
MVFLAFTVVMVIVCRQSGKWKNWKEYYSTILYLFIGDVVCDQLVYNKPLWSLNQLSYLYPILDIGLSAVLYPCTVILFLSYYPASKKKQITYYLLWVFLYSGVEFISFCFGDFLYFNGWNICYSVIFNAVMFPMIRLHYKRPIITWPISTVLALIFIFLFRIPLARF